MRHRKSHLSRRLHRRGVAMLLVLIGVVTVTILATAYLASRDNSVEVSRNVQGAVDGRWAAASAVERAIAVLKGSTDWRSNESTDLLTNHVMGNVTIDVTIEDMATGGDPTEETQHVLITATATPAGGAPQTATATAFIPLQRVGGGAAVDFSEFAVFARLSVTLRDDATLRRWPAAPLSGMGRRLAIGTTASSSGLVAILDNAVAVDTTLYHAPGASSTLLTNNSPVYVPVVELPDEPHVAAPRDPGVPNPDDDTNSYSSLGLSGEIDTFDADARYSTIDMTSSTLTLDGPVTLVSEDDLAMTSSSIIVTGHATIVVFDDLIMNGSTISIDPGATLRLFVAEDITLDDGAIGDSPMTSDPTGGEPYQDPNAVQLWQIDWFDDSNVVWDIGPNAVFKGVVYGPWAKVNVNDDSAIYGRVLAKRLVAQADGAIYYDHRLDTQSGYINVESGVYDETNSVIVPEVNGLASLDPGVLLLLSAAINAQVYAVGEAHGEPSDPGALGPLAVEYSFQTFGADIRAWETEVVLRTGTEPIP